MWFLRAVFCVLWFYGSHGGGDSPSSVSDRMPYFVSRNFYNTLRWNTTEEDAGVLYSVSTRSTVDGAQLLPKAECQNVSGVSVGSCDLTADTPPLPGVEYNALLYADGRFLAKSVRFKPVADTVLGAPLLSLRVSGSSLLLNVTLPLGPRGQPLQDLLRRSRTRDTSDPVVRYTLQVTTPGWAAQVNDSLTGRYAVRLKNNDTEYCGHVVYRPNFLFERLPSDPTTFCVLMPKDRGPAVSWVLLAGGLVLVLGVLTTLLIYLYTHPRKRPRLPPSMQGTWGSSPEPRLLAPPDQGLVFSVLTVRPPGPGPLRSRPAPGAQVAPARAAGGYSPQGDPSGDDDRDHSGGSASTGGYRSTATQSSSGSYAQVVVKETSGDASGPSPDAWGPCVERALDGHPSRRAGWTSGWDTGGQEATPPTSPGGGPAPWGPGEGPAPWGPGEGPAPWGPGDAPLGPLVLPALRNRRGELVLSLVAFQPQAGGGDEEEEQEEEQQEEQQEEQEQERLLGEGGYKAQAPPRLLLSPSVGGSEDWDSGCGRSDSTTPTQPSLPSLGSPALWSPEPDPLASGYKQNWFPGAGVGEGAGEGAGGGGETPCGYQRGHLPWAGPEGEEGEEREEREEWEEEQGEEQVCLRGWLVQVQE